MDTRTIAWKKIYEAINILSGKLRKRYTVVFKSDRPGVGTGDRSAEFLSPPSPAKGPSDQGQVLDFGQLEFSRNNLVLLPELSVCGSPQFG